MPVHASPNTYTLSAETWLRLLVYLVVVVLVLGTVAFALHYYGPGLIEFVLQFLLPDSWLFAGRALVERLLDAQSLVVLINTGMASVIVLVSLFTFVLKEWVSASYEQDTQCTGGRPPQELPLWRQALEEAELGVFYLALTLVVLRLGLSEDESSKTLGVILSHVLLVATMAIDYISPTLQRHGLTYTDILRTLTKRPLKSVGFGLVFASGPVLTGYLLQSLDVGPVIFYLSLASVHLLSLMGAVLVGTLVGGQFVSEALDAPPIGRTPRVLTWVVVLIALSVNGVFFGSAAHTIFGLTPILKCDWSIVDGSFKIDEKTLLPPSIVIGATVTIHNPTDRTAALGPHQVEVLYRDGPIASTQLTQFEVNPSSTVTQPLKVRIRQEGGLLRGLVRTGSSLQERGAINTLSAFVTMSNYSARIVFPTPVGDLPIILGSAGPPPSP